MEHPQPELFPVNDYQTDATPPPGHRQTITKRPKWPKSRPPKSTH
jgi:hypothetical protein